MPNLPEVDFRSSDWLRFRVWVEQELEGCRTALENSAKTVEETAKLRGTAAFCRKLLSLAPPSTSQ